MEITVDILQRDGFGKQPRFYVILAVDKCLVAGVSSETVVGMAFFYPIYSTWQGLVRDSKQYNQRINSYVLFY